MSLILTEASNLTMDVDNQNTEDNMPITLDNAIVVTGEEKALFNQCVFCKKMISQRYLANHVRVCNIRLKCHVCNRHFQKYPSWLAHVRLCNSKFLFCEKCGKKKQSYKLAQRHQQLCKKKVPNPERKVLDHCIKMEELNQKLKKICDANVTKQNSMSRTTKKSEQFPSTSRTESSFVVDSIGLTQEDVPTVKPTEVKNDVLIKLNPGLMIECIICGNKYMYLNLFGHVARCGVECKCNVCNMKFRRYPKWSEHVEKCTMESLYCMKCGKRFGKNTAHKKKHEAKCNKQKKLTNMKKDFEMRKQLNNNILENAKTNVASQEQEIQKYIDKFCEENSNYRDLICEGCGCMYQSLIILKSHRPNCQQLQMRAKDKQQSEQSANTSFILEVVNESTIDPVNGIKQSMVDVQDVGDIDETRYANFDYTKIHEMIKDINLLTNLDTETKFYHHQFPCITCGKLVPYMCLFSHSVTCIVDLKCHVCDLKYLSYNVWSRHISKCTIDTIHCRICKRRVNSFEKPRHEKICKGKRNFTIDNYKFNTLYQMNLNMLTKSQDIITSQIKIVKSLLDSSNYTCDQCGATCTTRKEVGKHFTFCTKRYLTVRVERINTANLSGYLPSSQSIDEVAIDSPAPINDHEVVMHQGSLDFNKNDENSHYKLMNEDNMNISEKNVVEYELIFSTKSSEENKTLTSGINAAEITEIDFVSYTENMTEETPIPCLVLVPHTPLAGNDKELAEASNETDGESRNSDYIPEIEDNANDICESLDGSLNNENRSSDCIEVFANLTEQCNRCLDDFLVIQEYQDHLIKCNRYKCSGCETVLCTNNKRINHYKLCANYKDAHMNYTEEPCIEENGNCPHCGKLVSLTESNFSEHLSTCKSTIKKITKCPMCCEYFTSQFMLLMHYNTFCFLSFRGYSFPCGMCSYTNSDQKNTLTHIKDIHSNEITEFVAAPANTFGCCKCGEVFDNVEGCKVHVQFCVE